MRLLPLLSALVVLPALAADPAPEIQRDPAAPQAVGAAHTLRAIPEACVRLEGSFTGDAADPYAFAAVRTSASCQPRAHLVDATKVQPSLDKGWKFNDLIQVPNAACPSQQAVVRVWRKPADVRTPELDGQGRARIYLDKSMQAIEAGELAPVPLFAAAMTLEGEPCNG